MTTRLVQVSAVVQDRQGNPVGGLTRDDFELLDNGKPQEVSLFLVETNVLPGDPLPLPQPDTFTNRLQLKEGTNTSVTVILLDGLNTKFEDQSYALQQVAQFLRQLQPQGLVAIYTLGKDLVVLRDFTSDRAALLRAVERYQGQNIRELQDANVNLDVPAVDSQVKAAMLNLIQGSQLEAQIFQTRYRIDLTVAAFTTIAKYLGGLPGRKSLIWVSGSFPISIGFGSRNEIFSDEILKAARALDEANVAIYPVDARGLIPPDLGLANSSSGLPGPNAVLGLPPQTIIDTMLILAGETGGRAFYNTNDLRAAIFSAIDDSQVSYTLGFYPVPERWDGTFHRIKVAVKRPGLHVRARSGYLALPDVPLKLHDQLLAIGQVARGPLDATGLALTARVIASAILPSRRMQLQVQFDVRSIRLNEQDGKWEGGLRYDFVQRDRKGKILSVTDQDLKLHLSRESYERAVQHGFQFLQELFVLTQTSQVRVVVSDENSSALGSVSIPVEKLSLPGN